MEESVVSAEVEIIGTSKSVQELALNSENLPNYYIYDEGGVGFRDALLPSESDFHVHIGNLNFPSTAQQELHKLQSALHSCGFFLSPIHRVVVNSEKERLTVAMFCRTDSEKEIKPVDKLVNESRPILYRPVKDYARTYFQYSSQ